MNYEVEVGLVGSDHILHARVRPEGPQQLTDAGTRKTEIYRNSGILILGLAINRKPIIPRSIKIADNSDNIQQL